MAKPHTPSRTQNSQLIRGMENKKNIYMIKVTTGKPVSDSALRPHAHTQTRAHTNVHIDNVKEPLPEAHGLSTK